MHIRHVWIGLALWLSTGIPGWCDAPGVAHLTLDAAVDLALKQRPDLKATVDDPKPPETVAPGPAPTAASFSFSAVANNFQTVLDGTPSLRPPFESLLPSDTVFDENLYAGMPLYISARPPHRAWMGTDLEGTEIVRLAHRAQVADIVRTTRVQFLHAIEARDDGAVLEDLVAKETEASQLAQAQFEAGKVPQSVAFRGRIELASAKERLNDAKSASTAALLDLKLALGLDQGFSVVVDGDFNEHPLSPGDENVLVATALKQRPDLLGATKLLPTGLKGGLQTLQQMVKRDVYKAYMDVQTALENLSLATGAIDAAQENLRISHLRFETGHGIQFEVLDALEVLTKARLDRVRAACRYQTALAQLDWAVGNTYQK